MKRSNDLAGVFLRRLMADCPSLDGCMSALNIPLADRNVFHYVGVRCVYAVGSKQIPWISVDYVQLMTLIRSHFHSNLEKREQERLNLKTQQAKKHSLLVRTNRSNELTRIFFLH